MADEQLKFIVGADTSQFNAELQKAENELKQFQSALKKTTDVNALEVLNGKIQKTQQTIASLNNSFKSISPSANKATQSITDLSRIVQDAPFGFIGIANNINPLVESFGRLKAESGSVGGALKALLSGLSGPAGLGIAFAVVTSAISFAQMGFSRWGGSAAKAKEETDKFAEGLKSAEQGAIAQGVRLEGLTKIITNSAASERDRNLALAEANKLLEPYGKKIDSLNISVAKAKELTDAYTEALINQAIGAKLADKIAELRIKKVEILNQLELQKAVIAGAAAKKTAEANALTTRQYGTSDRAALQYLQTTTDVTVEQGKLVGINSELVAIQKELNSYTDQYNATVTQTLKIDKERAKTAGETLPEALAKFNKSLKAIQLSGISIGTPQFDINNDKIKEFESFLKKIIEKFNVAPKDKVYIDLEARLNKIKDENFFIALKAAGERARKAAADILGIIPIDDVVIIPRRTKFEIDLETGYRENIIKELKRLSEKFKFDLPAGVFNLNTEGLKKQYDDITKSANGVPDAFRKNVSESLRKSGAEVSKAWEKYSNDINSAATGFLTDAATNIAVTFGEALGAALSGGNFGKVFSGIFELLANGVESLGKQLIAIGTLAVVAQQAIADLLANPFAAIGVGIALVALGAALKNLTNRKAFAVGTRYAPGGMALVGERGPEMINLPRGSQVIPAAQTSNMMGGIGGQIEVFGMLRGQDIYFSNKKYGQTYGRTT